MGGASLRSVVSAGGQRHHMERGALVGGRPPGRGLRGGAGVQSGHGGAEGQCVSGAAAQVAPGRGPARRSRGQGGVGHCDIPCGQAGGDWAGARRKSGPPSVTDRRIKRPRPSSVKAVPSDSGHLNTLHSEKLLKCGRTFLSSAWATSAYPGETKHSRESAATGRVPGGLRVASGGLVVAARGERPPLADTGPGAGGPSRQPFGSPWVFSPEPHQSSATRGPPGHEGSWASQVLAPSVLQSLALERWCHPLRREHHAGAGKGRELTGVPRRVLTRKPGPRRRAPLPSGLHRGDRPPRASEKDLSLQAGTAVRPAFVLRITVG